MDNCSVQRLETDKISTSQPYQYSLISLVKKRYKVFYSSFMGNNVYLMSFRGAGNRILTGWSNAAVSCFHSSDDCKEYHFIQLHCFYGCFPQNLRATVQHLIVSTQDIMEFKGGERSPAYLLNLLTNFPHTPEAQAKGLD